MTLLYVVLILFFLQLKHLIVDFYLQTDAMVAGKGKYGNWTGASHSLLHGVVTSFVLIHFVDLKLAFVLGVFDFLTHYHIDWAKMNLGNRDIRNKKFWHHLGLDQFAHQLVYILILIFCVGVPN